MIDKSLNTKKSNSVVKATLLVFLLSLLAKGIGFLKSVIQAAYFGTNIYTDAFNVANGFVGNVIYMLTTAVAVAFVPLYIQQKEKNNSKRFASSVITSLSLIALILSAILFLIAPIVVRVLVPDYSQQEQIITVKYFRVLVIGFVFSLLVDLYTNLLNSEKVYGFSTLCSVINSIVLIFFIIFFSNIIGVWSLVIAVPISYFIQWLVLYFKGRKYGKISFNSKADVNCLKLLIVQAVPILMSQATVEINQVIDRSLLSSIGEGVVTAVSYSIILYQFVTTLIGLPLSTVMFTELSEAGTQRDNERIKHILNSSIHVIFEISIPVVLVMFFCSRDIVNIVYGHGKFSDQAVINCSNGLKMYSFCLIPVCIKKVLSRAYYAINNTKRPMVIGVFEVVLNVVLSVVLVKPFGVFGVVGATGIASCVFLCVMIIDYSKTQIRFVSTKNILAYWKVLIATIVSFLVLFFSSKYIHINSLFNFLINTILAFAIFFLILLITNDDMFILMRKKCNDYIKMKLKK